MGNRCKLMYIVESFATGVYYVIKDLTDNLPREKFEIVVIHSLRPETPTTYKQDFSLKHVKLVYVPMDSALNYVLSIPRLIKTIKAERPDVVHLYSSRAGFLGRVACKLVGFRRVFYSPQGFSFLRSDVGKVKQKLYFLLEYIAALLGGTIVASSEGELHYAKECCRRVIKIDNSVNTTAIEKMLRNSKPSVSPRPVIGIVGRITAARNPEMFRLLAVRMPNIQFIWVGDGSEKEQPRASNIEITGFLSWPETLNRMADLDVYVQTSLWEGMSIAVLEAMALGKPVVATNIIGNKDVINHGKTGFLANNFDDFVRYIGMLIDDLELRTRIGNAAAQYVREHHDVRLAVKRYSELYLTER